MYAGITTYAQGTVFGLQQAGYGHIEWNLPQTLDYQPGQPILIVLRVTNPTPAAREYKLFKGLYDPQTKELIPETLGLITVDNRESFTVPGESWVQMEGEIVIDRSNVIFAIILYDVALNTPLTYVATHLVAPTPGLGLTPIIGGLFAVAVLGMMAMKVKGLFKE